MSQNSEGYSSAEISAILKKYVDDSAERLRERLKVAWKKQPQTKLSVHEKATL